MKFSEIVNMVANSGSECKLNLALDGKVRDIILNGCAFGDNINNDYLSFDLKDDTEIIYGLKPSNLTTMSIDGFYTKFHIESNDYLDFLKKIVASNTNWYDWNIELKMYNKNRNLFSINDVENRYDYHFNDTYKHLIKFSKGILTFKVGSSNYAKIDVDKVYKVDIINDEMSCAICRNSVTDCTNCDKKQKSQLVKVLESLGL